MRTPALLLALVLLGGCSSLSGQLASGSADLTDYRLRASGSVVGLGGGVDADLARPPCLVAEVVDEVADRTVDASTGPFVKWCRARKVDELYDVR